MIGLQEGLVMHIDNLTARNNIRNPEAREQSSEYAELLSVHPSQVGKNQNPDSDYSPSEHESFSTTETDIHNDVIENCEVFLQQSKQERQAIGRSNTQASRGVNRKADKKKPFKSLATQTEEIDGTEL
jgi:hypothetical protein